MGYKWNHFKTICKHKAVVFKECSACGITWQGLIHDLSKYSFEEFLVSAKYFQGNRSPIEAEKEYEIKGGKLDLERPDLPLWSPDSPAVHTLRVGVGTDVVT